jgi:hypothetical protein
VRKLKRKKVKQTKEERKEGENKLLTFGFLKIAGNFLNGCTIGSF